MRILQSNGNEENEVSGVITRARIIHDYHLAVAPYLKQLCSIEIMFGKPTVIVTGDDLDDVEITTNYAPEIQPFIHKLHGIINMIRKQAEKQLGELIQS